MSIPVSRTIAALAALALTSAAGAAEPGASLAWGDTAVSVGVEARAVGLRDYRFVVRSGAGAPRERRVAEAAGGPQLRTASALLDGLFALSLEEMAADSVERIADAAFDEGRPIDCRCFETGERWHYVWTRDVSYAADLALAFLDPERTRASLLFKTSAVRAALVAGGVPARTLVAQDTGSGGSWPVSTDRVVWIHAATDTLASLDGVAAEAFGRELLAIAADTLAQDREFAFDPPTGLYRGETSFLDWREQNYPGWTARDTRFIAESFALSTNVLHYVALKDTAALAGRAGDPRARAFAAEAGALKAAINRAFWIEDAGLYASYLAGTLKPLPVRTYDLLGLSLAVIHGIADAPRARRILRAYPATAAGPPVLFPEHAGVAIYHNRALWPFVTAYAVEAARRAREPALAARYAESLVRGAATALSNMENFEFTTQATRVEDGALSGPVINSPRQLWSVAAFEGLVVHSLWGLEAVDGGLAIEPFLPATLARQLAHAGAPAVLRGVRYRGATLNVTLVVPAEFADDSWLAAGRVELDGRPLGHGPIPRAAFRDDRPSEVRIELKVGGPAAPAPAAVAAGTDASDRWYAPATPAAPTGVRRGDRVRLALPVAEAGTTLGLYRDGERVASGLDGGAYTERLADGRASACYLLVATRTAGELSSLPGAELCLAARGDPVRIAVEYPIGGGPEPGGWGAPDAIRSVSFVAAAAGRQRLRISYRNANGPVNTGVTAAVKRISARCARHPDDQRGVVVMPHVAAAEGYAVSTAFLFEAGAGERCELTLSDGFNMSYLAQFERYTAEKGGRSGPLNRATLGAFEFEFVGRARAPGPRAQARKSAGA